MTVSLSRSPWIPAHTQRRNQLLIIWERVNPRMETISVRQSLLLRRETTLVLQPRILLSNRRAVKHLLQNTTSRPSYLIESIPNPHNGSPPNHHPLSMNKRRAVAAHPQRTLSCRRPPKARSFSQEAARNRPVYLLRRTLSELAMDNQVRLAKAVYLTPIAMQPHLPLARRWSRGIWMRRSFVHRWIHRPEHPLDQRTQSRLLGRMFLLPPAKMVFIHPSPRATHRH